MAGVPLKGSAREVSGGIEYIAPDTSEGITEIGFHITDTLGNVIDSGTVSITFSAKVEKTIVSNLDDVQSSWKKYLWIPIVIIVGGIATLIWKKFFQHK